MESDIIDMPTLSAEKETATKPPEMFTVFIKKDRGIIVSCADVKIGKSLLRSLSKIFNKPESEIRTIIIDVIQNARHIPLGVYTKEIAETKCQQANDAFNPDVSCVEIPFFFA